MPLLVHAALLGIKSRRMAMVFVWTCIALALASVAGGIVLAIVIRPILIIVPLGVSLAFVGCTWWYWYAVSWVDRHSSWDQKTTPKQ